MERTQSLIRHIAGLVQARHNCAARIVSADTSADTSGDRDAAVHWHNVHSDRLNVLARDFLPSGSGFDGGTTINADASTTDKIVLCTSFHHMNENGYYDDWTEHTIVVRPAFIGGFDLSISGSNRNDIKDYIEQVFEAALSNLISESADGYRYPDGMPLRAA